MCRWIAYSGKPVFIDRLVIKPSSSLVEQSLNSKMSFKHDGSILTTNGDGFGVGWYHLKDEPGLFKGAEPAWNNENLNEICAQTKAHIFMAHIRAASTGSIQRTNSHPFKYKNWLFQHNGYVQHFELLRQELQFDIAPEYFLSLKGTTDSETFFLLALTFGLQDNPKEALERTIKRIKQAYIRQNLSPDMIFSCALSDGKALYTMRYATGAKSHSQFYSTHAECMKDIDEDFSSVPKDSVIVVSEPLDQSGEHWNEMPQNSFAVIQKGNVIIEKLGLD